MRNSGWVVAIAFLVGATAPAVADDAADERTALAAALAEVNEDRPTVTAPIARSGFFGTGFHVDTTRAGSTVGGERFGERAINQPTAPRNPTGQRILSR